MVQGFLARARRAFLRSGLRSLALALSYLFLFPANPSFADSKTRTTTVPVLLLDGGRKLVFEGALSSERDVQAKRGFFKKVLDVMVGAPDVHFLVRPFAVVTDSRGRIIVSDPGAGGVHIFDLKDHKYKFITRKEKSKEAMTTPQCVAVDAQDNIYVTDSDLGKIFVFDPNGKFTRVIGSLKYGEGFFKHPTGIAVDSANQRIYVSDTWRDQIFQIDMQGSVLQKIGKRGRGNAEFNFPTDLRLDGDHLLVIDALNFRVQSLDRSGAFQFAIGQLGDASGDLFRPKAVSTDSEGHLYVVEGQSALVQVFDREGRLLYYFGKKGTGFGDFQLPTGMFIDREDRVYVVDSFNHRIQMFRYFALGKAATGGAP